MEHRGQGFSAAHWLGRVMAAASVFVMLLGAAPAEARTYPKIFGSIELSSTKTTRFPKWLGMLDRFQGRYRGKRYSFGYPACPDLGDQATLFRLLDGNKIGVELTEGFMMDPEASVSALVLHHPQARYFAA